MGSTSTEGALRVEIAGHVFRVVGARGAARAWIHERYRPFLTAKRARTTLTLEIQGRWPRGRPPGPRVDWNGDTFRIAMLTCRAEGDLAARRVRLSLPPAPAALSPSLFRVLSSFLLLREGGFLLHASAVVHRGRACVFCGPSGSGKTTVARLAGDRPVLNDETVAIVRRAWGYAACATPFFGEGGPAMAMVNAEAPLRAVFFLHQADRFSHRPLTLRQAVERAWAQVFLPKKDPPVIEGVLGNLTDFARQAACYDLSFAPREELWEYLDGIA